MIAVKVRTEFDEKTVLVPAELMGRKMLERFGAFTMTTARRSIKRAPKVDRKTGERLGRGRRAKGVEAVDASALEGLPPYSHGGTWKNLIQFAVYEDGRGVVIGLIKTSGGRTGNMPELTEVGGDATLRRAWEKQDRRVRYRAHPVMQPAMDKELPKAAGMLENKLK